MRNIVHTVNFDAAAQIQPYRIVEHGATDTQVQQASTATDGIIGVGPEFVVEPGEPCDVHVGGIAEVEYGGTVARGALLTSNASGQAISTTTAGNRTVGIAMKSGVSGDIGSVQLSPGSV